MLLFYKIILKDLFVCAEPSALISFVLFFFFGTNTPAPVWIIHDSTSVRQLAAADVVFRDKVNFINLSWRSLLKTCFFV